MITAFIAVVLYIGLVLHFCLSTKPRDLSDEEIERYYEAHK